MNQAEGGWAFFDKIYCISLDSRGDRREQAKKQFADVGLTDRVEFVVVTKHPEDQEQGIFESHMHCLHMGLRAKARRILVFEDDVFFQGFDGNALEAACVSLEAVANWNALFFGCITAGSRRIGKSRLAAITYRCLAHAYALNQPFAERIVRENWSGIPFDELLRRHNKNFFALYPMCAFQGLAGSDNQTVVIDRLRRFFGGLPFIQKVNELYQNHKPVLLLVPLAGLLVLSLAALRLW